LEEKTFIIIVTIPTRFETASSPAVEQI